MKTDHFIQVEQKRRDAYQLLAAMYSLPESSLISRLPRLTEILSDYAPAVSEILAQLNENIDINELKVDYSLLFLGPFKTLAAPYGSIYLEPGRQVMGKSTADVASRYEDAGVEVSNEFKDAPDHISAELEFMYFLIYQELAALEEFGREGAIVYLEKQRAFLTDHLAIWLPMFAQAVEENATTDFYKNVAKATLDFVQQDLVAINEMIPE